MKKAVSAFVAIPLALAIGLFALFPMPVMGDDVDTWSPTAGNNNSAAPNGFPENMAPSGVNDAAREVMAAIKRWYDDTQPSIVTTGSANAYAFAASQSISSYATGHVFGFIANHNNTGSATLNVDSVGAKTIVKPDGSNLSQGDIIIGQHVVVSYSATADNFQILSPVGSGGISTPVAVADGGTGATDAGTARTNLGVAIGADVQAFDDQLSDIAGLSETKGNIIVNTGSAWVNRAVGPNDQVLTADSAEADGVKWAAPVISEIFESAEQTITNGGSLYVAHGLAATPDNFWAYLVNNSADCGYAPGQIVDHANIDSNPSQRGWAASVTNATHIFIRFGSDGLILLNNDNGSSCAATSGDWRLVIRAYN